ncbi:hypothetical protein [Novipirellula maiorica]|nr:hypothetical protein [Rhodopirellula maiorica]
MQFLSVMTQIEASKARSLTKKKLHRKHFFHEKDVAEFSEARTVTRSF